MFTVLSSLVGQNTLGLALASLMQRASKPVRTVVGGIVVTAWVLPEVVAGFLLYAFFRREGTLNAILDWLHLPTQNWLFTLPILAVWFANVSAGTAFSMLVLGGPERDTEGDHRGGGGGRGGWLAPHVAHHAADDPPLDRHEPDAQHPSDTVGVRADLGDDEGRPGEAQDQTLPLFMYEQAFQKSMIGYGTAVALLLLVVGSLFSLVYMRLLRTEV